MTDNKTLPEPNIFEQYKEAVKEFHTQLNATSLSAEQLEQSFLKILTLRETVDIQLRENVKQRGNATILQDIATVDESLYSAVQLARHQSWFNPAKWQYILPNPDDAGWWWRLDQIPIWMNNEIQYEQRFSLALIPAIILFVVALGVALLSAQQLWANGQQWIGNLSLVGQILIGAGLISQRGRDVATRLLNQFLSLLDDTLSRSSDNNQSHFPLAKRRSSMSLGILGVAILFFAFVVSVTVFLIPAGARWLHEMGVRAVEERNASRAEFYLQTAVAIQPDFAILPFGFNGAPSLSQLGSLYREMGNMDAARDAYEKALAEDSRTVNVHYRLAEIYIADGNMNEAFAVLDQALILLNQHLAGEIDLLLGTDDVNSESEAKQLKYLTLITRSEAFLALENGYTAALRDLDNARLIVNANPELFIVVDNMGANHTAVILTTKLHVLTGRSLALLLGDACLREVQDEWRVVRRLSRFAITSDEQLWLDEANVTLETCRR